jgi:TRAP transporter TAXI family solute receptor
MKLAAVILIAIAGFVGSAVGTLAQTERITMLGGPPAGVFGIFGTGIGTFLTKNVPGLDVSVAATAGSVENIRRVNAKDAEMGISFSSDVHEAYNGIDAFKGKQLPDIRTIGVVFVGVAHLVTFADSGIKSVEDLAGKRVALGTPGSGTFATAERVFRAVGIWDKLNRIPLLGAAAGQALAEGKADAYFWTGPAPDRVTMEAATTKPVKILDIYTAVSKTDFFKQYPYFARYVYSAGSYRGVTEDVSTVGVPALWVVNKDVSASLVQKIVAAVYGKEGNAHMLNVHAGAKDMVPEKALQGITVPLHKGAEDHWRSVKLQIPEGIRAK